MEQETVTKEVKKKDIWLLAYKNIIQLAFLGGFISLVLISMWIMDVEGMKTSGSLIMIGLTTASAAIWYYLSQLFKRREKKAISIGYTLFSVFLLLGMLGGNIIAVLIHVYLLSLVYRASKVSVVA